MNAGEGCRAVASQGDAKAGLQVSTRWRHSQYNSTAQGQGTACPDRPARESLPVQRIRRFSGRPVVRDERHSGRSEHLAHHRHPQLEAEPFKIGNEGGSIRRHRNNRSSKRALLCRGLSRTNNSVFVTVPGRTPPRSNHEQPHRCHAGGKHGHQQEREAPVEHDSSGGPIELHASESRTAWQRIAGHENA